MKMRLFMLLTAGVKTVCCAPECSEQPLTEASCSLTLTGWHEKELMTGNGCLGFRVVPGLRSSSVCVFVWTGVSRKLLSTQSPGSDNTPPTSLPDLIRDRTDVLQERLAVQIQIRFTAGNVDTESLRKT